ncbi:MAG: hypothetical protein IJY57_00940 [Clostridia bacterium]|nr:hypothetical protein [Clostridia bacterium]
MIVKDKLIKEYPLTKKVECSFECYEVVKRKYVIFFNEKINMNNMETLLNDIATIVKNKVSMVRTFIVVGETEEQFKKEDLVYFNGVDTFVVYYLKNIKDNTISFNEQRMLFFGAGWRKIIKKFNKILLENK